MADVVSGFTVRSCRTVSTTSPVAWIVFGISWRTVIAGPGKMLPYMTKKLLRTSKNFFSGLIIHIQLMLG